MTGKMSQAFRHSRLTFLCLIFILAGCRREQQPLEFYFFRQTLDLSTAEINALKTFATHELVVKYFDVTVKNGVPVPVAKLRVKSKPANGIKVIPLVYVSNEVMTAVTSADSSYFRELASDVNALIRAISDSNDFKTDTVHIDCDWTLKSRDGYFLFLSFLKQLSNNSLIATLRLHQIKYVRETGIPPADGYVLMLYNFGKISSTENNSIFNSTSYRPYLEGMHDYPKAFSLALPVFGWWVWSRNGKVMDLIPVTTLTQAQTTAFTIKVNRYTYSIKDKTILNDYIFRPGDLLRLEKPDMHQIIDAVKELKSSAPQPIPAIYLYELQEHYLENYTLEELRELQTEIPA